MATIKELQAKFSADKSGMESSFNAIVNRLNDIEKASDRAARNIEKNMTRGMNRVFKTGEGFEKVGSTFTNISKKSEEVGSNLTNKITKPAMIAGGALASITIGKGFGRLVEIDNAKAKLDGLGHSSESVQKIMDNALESVKGTSFGLGEAATTASSAVAAGIKPGKELTRYLSLTGDAAAIAGSSMGEMGSIINKVQTSNKAYNGELQQLSERGIPIYQWIAKEAKVTADEVFNMARDGEVSSEMFLNAIETNIGGAAKKMGQKSFTASLANMWAAVGRLGASFLDAGGKGGGFFSKMKPLMNDLTTAIDGMEGSAAKWGETLGQVLDKVVNGIKGIVNWYNSLDKNTQKLIASIMQWSTLILVGLGPVLMIFSKLTGIIGAIFGPFGKFLKFFAKFSTAAKSSEGAIIGITKVFPKLGAILGTLTGPVGWITLGVIALGTAFVVAYKKSETFRNIVNAALNGVKQTFITIGNIIKGFFQLFKGNGQDGVITLSKILPPNVVVGLTNFATKVKTTFYQVVNAISNFARSIGTQISSFWAKNGTEIITALRNVGSFISTTFKFIWGNVIKPIMTLIWNLMKILWPAIRLLIVSVWQNIKGVIQGATNIILGIIKVFSSLLTGNWKGVWQGIVQILKGAVVLAWNLVQLWFVGKILKAVKVGLGLLRGVVVKGWSFIRNFIGKTAQSIWNSVRTKFSGLSKSTRDIFTNLSNWCRGLWTRLKNFITNLAQNIWTNVRNKFSGMSKSSREIFGRLLESAKNIFTNIKNRVTSLAHGARDNVVNGFKAMYDKGKSWIDKLKNFLSGSVSGFKSIASKVGKGIANGAISGLNKMIDGVNWLSKKIMDKKLIKDKIAKLSTGTGGSNGVKTNSKGQLQEDTLAMVNDKGPGNGKGPNGHQELIRDKDGSLFAPKGRNVVLPLKKGMEVINGRDTQNMYGGIPRFSAGSATKKQTNKKKSAFEQGFDNVKAITKATADATVKTVAKKGGELAGKATSKALEVWDYIENPGKLVQIALDKFGVDFSSIKGVYGSFMKHGFAGLKKGLVKKVMSWFDEAGGYGNVDGSSILKHGVSFGYSPNKPLPGYPLSINGGRHYGIDTPHSYEKIQAPTGGIVRAQSDFGGGTIAQILSGKVAQYYLHLEKVLKTGRIKQGETFAKTGNSGHYTTGAHLHTQIEDPAANALTNRNTKDPVKFLNSKGGKSGGGGWLNTIRTALKIAKLPVTQKYINAWMKQIQTESSGNARAIGGNDGLADGNAMGLVQVKPGTFKANQGKGMGDIWNPLHNLVAGMNYAKNTYGSRLLGTIGQGHGYANGGIINSPEIAWLAEGGFSETVISHDPSMKARSKVIWDRTGEMLGFSEDAELLRGIISAINEGNSLQQINNRDTNRIANKDTNVYLDGKEISKATSSHLGNSTQHKAYLNGSSIFAGGV
ncbi:tape measure protein [Mammaliicoccus sciuri]|uniref:tape measure protein n=1 Tax=Mammaliicoccus sciuri TaxID=1296 RepID=UPI002DBE3F91|nr:tape measure protein [Mammaliicoccus sciuri]MEB8206571.1 tape measure protein [Mammaliicoccus sciuri]